MGYVRLAHHGHLDMLAAGNRLDAHGLKFPPLQDGASRSTFILLHTAHAATAWNLASMT